MLDSFALLCIKFYTHYFFFQPKKQEKRSSVAAQISSSTHPFDAKQSNATLESITHVFKLLGELLKQHQATLVQHFGPGSSLFLIDALLEEVEALFSPAAQFFARFHSLDSLHQQIRKIHEKPFPPSSVSSSPSPANSQPTYLVTSDGKDIDIKRLTITLQNLSLISQRFELLRRFLSSKVFFVFKL